MNNYARKGDIPTREKPQRLIFSLYSAEDIRKLSVLKIVSPVSFDSMGYPLPGGLYDKALGALDERGEPCGTCFKNFSNCPGHFGHIELPLPVINPLFEKFVASVLRITCLKCYRLQVPAQLKYSLRLQLGLSGVGMIVEALEIERRTAELSVEYGSFENIPVEGFDEFKQCETMIQNARAQEKLEENNKTLEAMTKKFLRALNYVKSKKVCVYCKKPMHKLQIIGDKWLLTETDKLSKIKSEPTYMSKDEIRQHLRCVWKEEKDFITLIAPVLQTVNCEIPTDCFFFEVVPVAPINTRPVEKENGKVKEGAQSNLYKAILHDVILLRVALQVLKNKDAFEGLTEAAKEAYKLARGKTPVEKVMYTWDSVQNTVKSLITTEKKVEHREKGLKQIIEKKAGIIRMNMMGKRVNFSARSVVTPDPILNINEIGIPIEFAKKLTFPIGVTPWNVDYLRKLVINGPDVYPGANFVEFEDGRCTRLSPDDAKQRRSIANRLLTPPDNLSGFQGFKRVFRHLSNGDALLLNRQPSLHKPSIMAHNARILKGEKTLRLHYANCKAYNADFDGDEMNVHYPQHFLGQSEACNLVNVAQQYLVPKDGSPLSGLIQDHIIMAVKMSVRGKFFTRIEYQQLVFQGLGNTRSKVVLLPPALIKPAMLWTGKQVVSSIIINLIPRDMKRLNMTSTAKIPVNSWQTQTKREWKYGGTPLKDNNMTESEVIIRNGELLVGVLDKAHFGASAYGLIHCVYELYGGNCSNQMLSAFSKLCTYTMNWFGFTLGVQDILVTQKANKKRTKIISKLRETGPSIIAKALNIPEDTPIAELETKLLETCAADNNFRNIIDHHYKSALNKYTNDVNKACLQAGLQCRFPENNLQLMVQSGAKGSTVNTMQISSLLGQIELEGKRPPTLISGKYLPAFPTFDMSPRAGGFIDGRFMTGIKMQEFFFHCQAGREGLIDTACKTARSGYLQRCLIKHLEGVKVNYDMTVRDSDNTIIEFCYGEDGLDISKSQFLNKKQMQFLADNSNAIVDKDVIKELQDIENYDAMEEYGKKLRRWKDDFGDPRIKRRASHFSTFTSVVNQSIEVKRAEKTTDSGRTKKTEHLLKMWENADEKLVESLKKKCERCPDPVSSLYRPDLYFGALNERLESLMEECKNFEKKKDKKKFVQMFKLKSMQALCQPGEPVGILAAQSIGEPSTQMTLNTFHFAGRGEMNVTLGIPRLREILMTASKNIATPTMEVPFLDVVNLEKKAGNLKRCLTRVVVANVLEKMTVEDILDLEPTRQQRYIVRFHFLPHRLYKSDYKVKPKRILKHMTGKFFGQMFTAIRKSENVRTNVIQEYDDNPKQKKTNNDDDDDGEGGADKKNTIVDDDDDSSDEEIEDPEQAKLTHKRDAENEDQEPELDEGELSRDEDEDEENKDAEVNTTKVDTEEIDENTVKEKVVDSFYLANDYVYDAKNHLWCELTFTLPLTFTKIDLQEILKTIAQKSVIWETPNIKRAITYEKNNKLMLKTEGINIIEMFKYSDLLDLNKLYSNDIHKVAETYGIEAAVRVIVKEIQDVFHVYGITVDPRHLKLIADYMTLSGNIESFSRRGMESSASPLQQMTFETSVAFLSESVLKGKFDQLSNPSSCLMVGKPCTMGTGNFGLKSVINWK